MGWSSGYNHEGRLVGYGHPARCDVWWCRRRIDLGLAYCCGDLDGVEGEHGCGHYFCGKHEYKHRCASACGKQACMGAQWHERQDDDDTWFSMAVPS